MHLKSTNGPIDVLVCPEGEEDHPQLPHPSSLMTNQLHTDSPTATPSKTQLGLCLTPTHNTPNGSIQQHTPHVKQEQLDLEDELDHFRRSETLMNPLHTAIHHSTPQHHSTSTIHVAVNGNGGNLMDPPLRDDLDISLSSAADVCNTNDLEELMDSYNCGNSNLLPSSDISLSCFESLDPPLQDEDFSFSLDGATEGIQDLFDLVS